MKKEVNGKTYESGNIIEIKHDLGRIEYRVVIKVGDNLIATTGFKTGCNNGKVGGSWTFEPYVTRIFEGYRKEGARFIRLDHSIEAFGRVLWEKPAIAQLSSGNSAEVDYLNKKIKINGIELTKQDISLLSAACTW